MRFYQKFLVGIITVLIMPTFTLAQDLPVEEASPSQPSELPEFLQNVNSLEDFEALTPEQKSVAAEFFSAFDPDIGRGTAPEPAGNLSCFDYYTFGSVQVSVSPQVEGTVSGVPITFAGTLDNSNPYPVVDGAVYMKIFRLSEDGELPVNGYDVVWQGFVAEDITLQASSSAPIEFSWGIPSALPTGSYQAAFFFTSAKRFNLQGLPFTDDVVGNSVDFSVVGELEDTISFNKDAVTVGGQDYYFAAFTPKVDKGVPIEVATVLKNDTEQLQTVPVTITTYAWDQQREENVVATNEAVVSVPAGSSAPVTHTVTDVTSSVYLVIFEAEYLDTKSVLNVRFTRENIPSVRLNFPAVTNYPLIKGEETTIFSCLHAAGTMNVVKGGRMELTITDDNTGQAIYSYTYEGDITGAMMAAGEVFTPVTTYDNFTLNAKLYRDNVLIDEVEMTYSCNELSGECIPVVATSLPTIADSKTQPLALLVILLALISLAIFTFVWNRKKLVKQKDADSRTDINNIAGPLVLLLVLMSGLFFGGAGEAEAKSKVVNYTSSLPYWYYQQTASAWASGGWIVGLQSPNVNVSYNANVYNHDTNALIPEGSVVPVGTKLRFVPSRGGISWNGTGHSVDTPTGKWIGGAVYPYTTGTTYYSGETYRTGQCKAEDFVSYSSFISGLKVHIPLSVNPGSMSVNVSGSTAGLSNLGGNVYQVTSPGNISATFSYASTYGRFYYEYYLPSSVGGGPVCRTSWDRLPMRNTAAYSLVSFMFAVVSSPYNTSLGNFWVPATNISYTLSANSPNTPPNIPNITNVGSNNYLAGSVQSFTIVGTDPDGDSIRYGVDWDMNGTIDQWTTYVASGGSRSISRNWATAGSKTFRARTQDDKGGLSGWRNHTVTINEPAPTLNFSATHNTANYPSGSTITIDAGQDVALNWNTTSATACTANGGWSGAKPTSGANVAITEPSPGTSATYSLVCTGPGGTTPTRSITIVTNTPPNFTEPSMLHTSSVTYDSLTGNYDFVSIVFSTTNNGGSAVTLDSLARLNLDALNDGVLDDTVDVTVPATIAAGASSPALSHTFMSVPFGETRVRVTVDNTNLINESNESDNTKDFIFTLLPQANLQINTDDKIVKIGDSTVLRWDTGVSYPMSCEVSWPGGVLHSFDPDVDGPTGNIATNVIQGEINYTLHCVEPVTGVNFDASTAVNISSIVTEQ